MKSQSQQFSEYVEYAGGRVKAAERLVISVGMVGHILRGRRGISPQIAMAIDADTQGQFPKARLRPDLWNESHN